MTAVGVGRALDKQPILFRAHLAREVVDVLHGVAPDTLAYHPGGIVDVQGPRKLHGAAKLLDSLIDERKHLAREMRLNGVVADKLDQPLQGRGEFGNGFLKIGLKIRPQRGNIATLRAFGAMKMELNER